MGLELFLAYRYLRAKRDEGFISIVAWFSLAGILLGVGTIIVVMSVFDGFRAELLGRILGVTGHVTVSSPSRVITDYERLSAELRDIPGVVAATPIVVGEVLATSEEEAAGAVIRGVDIKTFGDRPAFVRATSQPARVAFSSGQGALLGARIAETLNIAIGGEVVLISPKGTASPFGTIPRKVTLPVVGIIEFGMYDFDNTQIFLPLDLAQDFLRVGDAVSRIEVVYSDPEFAALKAQTVERQLGSGISARGWENVNAGFFNQVQVQRNVMTLILFLIVMVAAFNIISSQIMLVRDKEKGIAILRTMGASRAMILRIFLLTGSAIGVCGTVIGALLGVLFAQNIETIRKSVESLVGVDVFKAELYYLSELPSLIQPWEVFIIVFAAVLVSVLSAAYPAWRAARLDPVDVLRYD